MEQQKQSSALQNAELQVTEKTCAKCRKRKKVTEFHKHKTTSDGFSCYCKKCRNESRRKTDLADIAKSVPKGFFYCRTCKTMKKSNPDNFYKSKLTPESKVLTCIDCRRKTNSENQKKNREANRERHKKWRDTNRCHVRKKSREWKRKNPEKVAELHREYSSRPEVKESRKKWFKGYYYRNREQLIAKSCAYDSRVRRARPPWESQKRINKYYLKAKKLGLEVDHIVPINSEFVCGLHCVDNFQMLTREENARKGNRYWPEMPEDLCSSLT